MAIQVLTNAQALVGEYDFSGDLNELELGISVDVKDVSRFGGDGWRTRAAGQLSMAAKLKGLVEFGAGEPDPYFFDKLGVLDVPLTIGPTGGADGELVYMTTGVEGSYTPGAQIGDVLPFSAEFVERGQPVVRATAMHPAGTARTASGNGVARNLGGASGSQRIYAALHVLAASGTTPSLTVKVQSDDNAGFTSPADRITFSAATGITSQWASQGAIADTWWRITYTISGTTPSFRFAVAVGIQ